MQRKKHCRTRLLIVWPLVNTRQGARGHGSHPLRRLHGVPSWIDPGGEEHEGEEQAGVFTRPHVGHIVRRHELRRRAHCLRAGGWSRHLFVAKSEGSDGRNEASGAPFFDLVG